MSEDDIIHVTTTFEDLCRNQELSVTNLDKVYDLIEEIRRLQKQLKIATLRLDL